MRMVKCGIALFVLFQFILTGIEESARAPIIQICVLLSLASSIELFAFFPLHLLLSPSLPTTYMTILRLIDCNIFEKREESTFHGSEQCRGCSLSLSISSRVPLPSTPQRIEESRAGPRQIFSHGLKRQKVPYVCVCVWVAFM